MTRRATAQDVADLAGVSRSTVSVVLNGRAAGNISAAKQAAVREAAEQLRYTPNAVALSLRNKRTATIGVLTWADRRQMPLALLGEVYTAASSAGYLLLMVDACQRPDQVDALLDRRVDGFVVVAPELADVAVPEAVDGQPTVLVNCFDEGMAASCLVPDECGAGSTAAQHLIDVGHRRIGVLAGTDGLASERRLLGVRQAVAAAGLPDPLVLRAGHTIDDGYAATHRLLAGPDLAPSALVCTHERLALGALLAVADLGLSVPGDVSLVSLDDGENLAGPLVPSVDLVRRPDATIAAHALDVLVDQLRHGCSAPRRLSFTCPLQQGGSVAPPQLRAVHAG